MKNIDINEIKIGGAKKKNGHKSNCGCHICENIKNKAERGGYEEEEQIEIEKMNGGSKKKNGHRINCKCPICINMKNASRTKYKKKNRMTKSKKGGGDQEHNEKNEENIINDKNILPIEGGKRRKGNNHKLKCKCPICINIRKHKKGGEHTIETTHLTEDNNSKNEEDANDNDYAEFENIIGGRTRKIKKKHIRKTRRHIKQNK